MPNRLESELLAIGAETVDPAEFDQLIDDSTGERAFGRFSHDVLTVLQKFFPGVSAAWVSVAGLEPGFLLPIASLPEKLKPTIPKISKQEARDLCGNAAVTVASQKTLTHFRDIVPAAKQAIVTRLIGHQEEYGVLILCSEAEGYFNNGTLVLLKESLPLLNRLMADSNFSMRLRRLAAPFDFEDPVVTKHLMYREIVRQACRGFAADGSVLRVRKPSDSDPSGYTLEVEDSDGLVSSDQLEQSGAGQRICLEVFNSEIGMTVQTRGPDGSRLSFGAHITDEDDAGLRQFGVKAYMIMKLHSDLTYEQPSAIGVLSVFHRFPQIFSRRDISLFRGFCERVADDLALLDQRDANEAISRFLQVQNALGTRAEIIALLGHDFGHRVIHVTEGLQNLIETCRRNWRDRKLPDRVKADADSLEKSCVELGEIVRQIRLLGQGADEAASTFVISGVFAEIKQRLSLVFDRNRMALDAKTEGNCVLHGVRGILLQALFNLVVNAVDAQRESGRRKLNTVHLTCREVGTGHHRRLDFNVWDEGPGINRVAFPDAQHIFHVGRTSKPPGQGTGIGLPAARNLLGRYFHADLQLTDRSKALFQFSIPTPSDR